MSVYDHEREPSRPGAARAPGETRTRFVPSPEHSVAESGRRDVGLCVVGCDLASGYGDPRALGWVGRVLARTQHPDLDMTAYNLSLRGATSADVMGRWRSECDPRWQGRAERRLVISVGVHDIATGTTLARSRLNLANILDDATSHGIGAFVVGVAPGLDDEGNERLAALADAQQDVCARRGVGYVDCFRPLLSHEDWMADVAASHGAHPGQVGYGLLAWLVLHNGWREWLRLP